MQKISIFSLIVISLIFLSGCMTGYDDYDDDFHPLDRISNSSIKVYSDRILIEGSFGRIESKGTGSMLPSFFEGATYFYVKPSFPSEIVVGDIIVFTKPQEMIEKGFTSNTTTILHRVIGKGTDSEGIYYYTKGDNNWIEDGVKIRFENITKVIIGVIW